jgi:NTE family protein
MIKFGPITSALLRAWPREVWAWPFVFVAKLLLVLVVIAMLIPIAIVLLLTLVAGAVFVYVGDGLIGLLMLALVRWLPDDAAAPAPRPLPMHDEAIANQTEAERTARLTAVLGTFNAGSHRVYDGVFEGGGMKAIGQIGALARFHEEGLRPRRIVGTSGGAIVGSLLAAGASPERMWNMMTGIDLTELLDARWLPNQGWLRQMFYGLLPLGPALAAKKAAVRGERFLALMRSELQGATGLADATFKDLEERTGTQLELVTTDITRRKLLILPRDIADYREFATCVDGEPKNLSVAWAVRMSMAIPFVFEPVYLHDAVSGARCDIVDGGVSSNYPIWYMDSFVPEGPRFPTFGFLLDESVGNESNLRPVKWFHQYALGVYNAGVGSIDRVVRPHDEERTMHIPTWKVGTTEFGLSNPRQDQLFNGGYKTAVEKLASFNWDAYLTDYRKTTRARAPAETTDRFAALDTDRDGVVTQNGITYTLATEASFPAAPPAR